jgi:hypothetical protein
MKVTFLYNYTSITWREIHNLPTGDIGYSEKSDYMYKSAISFCIIGIKSKCTVKEVKNYIVGKEEKNSLPLKSHIIYTL